MTGKVNDGDLVTVEPLAAEYEPKVGDIVLCAVRGSQYLHLVKAVKGRQVQIGNNRGSTNGWVTRRSIYGVCTKVEP